MNLPKCTCIYITIGELAQKTNEVKERINPRQYCHLLLLSATGSIGEIGRLTFIKSKPAIGPYCFSEIQAYFKFKRTIKVKNGYYPQFMITQSNARLNSGMPYVGQILGLITSHDFTKARME